MNYSKLGWTAVIAAFAASMGAVPAAAKGGNAKAKQPTVRVTSAKAKPVKAAKAGPSATAGAKAKAPTPKVKAASGSGATKASKANGSRTVSGKPTLTASDPKPTLSANPAPAGTLNKAQQLLMKNDNLRMKMQERLGGMDPILAAADFRNLGQFVAAVNASYNDPTIEFRALRALMTGDPPMSLGQAKKQLRDTAPVVTTTPTLTTVTTTSDQR